MPEGTKRKLMEEVYARSLQDERTIAPVEGNAQ